MPAKSTSKVKTGPNAKRKEATKNATENRSQNHSVSDEIKQSADTTSSSELKERNQLAHGSGIDNEDIESDKMNPSPMVSDSTDFASFYLRTITKELSDDLDKIRSANDFSEQSVPILIHALQQGHQIFSNEERERIMRGTRRHTL